MVAAFAAALLALSSPGTPPAEVQVDVGRFDPASFPEARLRERRMPYNTMHGRVEAILREEQCALEGQNHRRYDIRVPYVVRLEPDGRATRFVVADMGCAPLESFVGQVVIELARVGDFRATGAADADWYASELRFTAGALPLR